MTLTMITLGIQNRLGACVLSVCVRVCLRACRSQGVFVCHSSLTSSPPSVSCLLFLFSPASALLSKPPSAASYVDMATANIGFVRF